MNRCLVVYDYLKLTSSTQIRDITEWQEIGFRVTQLHDLTVQYNFPCLTFTQLNRELQIAASDRISWFATSYCSFQKKEPEEIAEDGRENGNRKMIVEDCRFGPGLDDGDFINFDFFGKIGKITEGKTRNDLGRQRNEQNTGSGETEQDF